MSEDRKRSLPDATDPGEPTDLAEVRAARALARSVDGETAGEAADEDPAVGEALEAAALIVSSRAPELSDASRDRIAEELFGPATSARPAAGRRPLRFAAVGAAAAAALGLGLFALHGARGPAPATDTAGLAPLRGEAEELLASLLPPGGSPAGRADRIAREAEARLQALSEEGRP